LGAFNLAQGKILMPEVQLLEHCHGGFFRISYPSEGNPSGQQRAHMTRRASCWQTRLGPLSFGSQVQADMDGTFTVRQTDDQEVNDVGKYNSCHP
jgi:hypothetical protein